MNNNTNNIQRLQQTYRYELLEGFCKISNDGKLKHTTNEELGIDDHVGEGLEDVVEHIKQLLLA